MQLIDFLKTADIWKAVTYMRSHSMREYDDKAEHYAVYAKFRDYLVTLQPKPNEEGCILLGDMVYDALADEADDSVTLNVSMYHRKDADGFTGRIQRTFQLLPDKNACLQYNMEDARRLTDALGETPYPDGYSGYAFEFTEWEEVLGWDVDSANIEEVGSDAFTAHVLYELSFNGFDRESQDERRQELQVSIDEVDRLFALPEEEQKKHFHSAAELFEELGWKDTRTEEEKAAETLHMLRGMLYNAVSKAECLQRHLLTDHMHDTELKERPSKPTDVNFSVIE